MAGEVESFEESDGPHYPMGSRLRGCQSLHIIISGGPPLSDGVQIEGAPSIVIISGAWPLSDGLQI